MKYVDSKGFLRDMEGEALSPKALFPETPLQDSLAPLMGFVNTYPIIFQLISRMLDLDLCIQMGELSLIEKNKGGEYQSSGFTLTTTIGEASLKTDHPLLKKYIEGYLFSLKGVSFSTAIFSFIQEAVPVKLNSNEPQNFEALVSKDYWLSELLVNPSDGQTFLTTYKPFKLKGSIKLNSIDKAIYQSILTKYMEIECNRGIFTSQDLIKKETDYLSQRYSIWLGQLLQKSYTVEFIDYGS